ncbi:hypothetical protein NJ76_23365 [Rhodococcus sp. IITR03]|nr:hypothetical protein NJ76_23365 [Rhodococcus sp. IITR03]
MQCPQSRHDEPRTRGHLPIRLGLRREIPPVRGEYGPRFLVSRTAPASPKDADRTTSPATASTASAHAASSVAMLSSASGSHPARSSTRTPPPPAAEA